MIEVVVSLNGVEFEVYAPGDVYDGELPDFNAAVRNALVAHKQAFPLDDLESAALEVHVKRAFREVASRDGEGVDVARSPAKANESFESRSSDADPDRDDRRPEDEATSEQGFVLDESVDAPVEEGKRPVVQRNDPDPDPDDVPEDRLEELTAPDEDKRED